PGRAHGRSGGLSFRKRRRLERPDLPRRRRCAAPPPRESRMEMMAEWVEAMTDGPGIIVFRKTFADLGPIEAANAHFWAMIDEQHKNNSARGDHFAKPGANDRVWKRAGKALSRRPGRLRRLLRRRRHRARQRGLARTVLPDHLAAQRRQSGRRRAGPAPRLSHGLPDSARDRAISGARPSPMLTLQGAVAHCDMPLESGPTLYLPFSQTYLPGYLAALREEFRAYFETHRVQLPVAIGDAAFFNP